MTLSVQQFCGGFFLSEFVSGYYETKKREKKVPFATKLEGGGQDFSGQITKNNHFFWRLP